MKKKGLLSDDLYSEGGVAREQYGVGGKIAEKIARAIARRNKLEKELNTEQISSSKQSQTITDIEMTDKQIESLEKQATNPENIEASVMLEGEMSDTYNTLIQKGYSKDRASEIVEEVFENRNYSELEEALKRTPKMGGGTMIKKNRMTYKDGGGPGIEALRKEAPEVVTRMGYQEGGSLLADDMSMMEKENMQVADMVMEPSETMTIETDENMEENYVDYVISQALSEEEQQFLNEQLEGNEKLSIIFDQVIETASEFSGDGPVEGPGTGVSDDIPARLSDGEFVFTAKAVEEIGEDALMSMMKDAEANADERQQLNMGGQPMMEEEMKVDQYGKPVDPDIVEDDIRKNMLDVNPRLR